MKTISQFNRRSLFKAAGLGVAALATPSIMTRPASAMVAKPNVTVPDFSRFMLGEFEITIINDGARTVENPQGIFGTDQSVETVGALLEENFLPADKMQLGFAPTLVNTGADLILFDTGNGERGRDGGVGMLRAVMEGSGYAPEQVTIVVLTHHHPDHIGGMTEGDAPAFPNARYVTGRQEYDFWTSDDRMGTPAENLHKMIKGKVATFADKMSFLEPDAEVVSGVSAMAAFGHTPGHMVYRIESGGKMLMITADTANHFVASLQRPDWEVRFDLDKAAAAQTRKTVFDMIATDRIPFIGYHMPFPSVGFIEKLDVGYRFIPESYQLDL